MLLLLSVGCATYKPQYKDSSRVAKFADKAIEHSFYLVGDAGNSPIGGKSAALTGLEKIIDKAPSNGTLLYLGDNIYPHGLPKKGHKDREFAEHQLRAQAGAAKDFKGRTIFIPGNHDWYNDGPKGLKRQEEFVEDLLGKDSFLPENGCPITKVDINEEVVLIIVDSEWYMAKWDKYTGINDDCEFRNRNRFFDEYASLIKKARGKTTVVAIHHPMYTNGPHGGQYSFKQHMTPLPGLGTLKNVIRKTGGVSPADQQHRRYTEFKDRIITLSRENNKVVFVSGHEHNLQYLVDGNLRQIVSGSGSKINPTRNVGYGQFSYGAQGYARLDVFKDGSSYVRFYTADNKLVFETDVFGKDIQREFSFSSYPDKAKSSVYKELETSKSSFYEWLWGKKYRALFSREIEVPTVNLDTLFGGLTPVRKGGGNQSNSLRFEDPEGREFMMRAIRKNAIQYIQAVAFKNKFVKEEFKGTGTEAFIMDGFTGSHPYTFLSIGTLSDAVGIFHTNPELYYVPKQQAIGRFNDEFGDALYMIEERAADGHGDNPGFGYSDKLISTHDMLDELRKDEEHKVDEKAYIRARIFDMLIGDWDRHQDQWRWAIFEEGDTTLYRPVPRDRDQAFSRMDDGFVMGLATALMPPIRLLNSYDEELKNVDWMNVEPYPLDVALVGNSGRSVWLAEATFIQENLTDEVIELAFKKVPKEAQDAGLADIKQKLKGRRANIRDIAGRYADVVNRYAIVTGTDKDDWFDITRLPNGDTRVVGYRIKDGEKSDVIHNRVYNRKDTKEIWIYALDDDDHFYVDGEGNGLIKVRLVGGLNKDTYEVKNGNKVHLYDYKSKPNTFKTNKGVRHIRDDYETHNYDYKKPRYNSNVLIPGIGGNPDDGLKVGLTNTFTVNGFERNPFTSQHTFGGFFYTATSGFELSYKGEFANVLGSWNLTLGGEFTSPNFARNFFGYGNSTPNPNAEDEDNFDLDFNRVKLGTLSLGAGLVHRGEHGGIFNIGVNYQSFELEETEGRFIETFTSAFPSDNENTFINTEASYVFQNSDNAAFPTLGMKFAMQFGYTHNLDNSNGFGYLIPSLDFAYRLVPSGDLVFATRSKAHLNFGDDFEFYQAASIGGSDGLRGYRFQRFTGKSAFYQSSDLRWNFGRKKTGVFPIETGLFGGFDVGRVWVDDNLLLDPSFNDEQWNTSVGGGFFINAADLIGGSISLFNSDDGLRFAFAIGFGF
jgi:hypothetical protein